MLSQVFEFFDSAVKNVIIFPSAIVSFIALAIGVLIAAFGWLFMSTYGGWIYAIGAAFFALGLTIIFVAAPLGVALLITLPIETMKFINALQQVFYYSELSPLGSVKMFY